MSADDRHRRDWETLGELDPLYAILSGPEHRLGGWDQEAFFAAGRRDADRLLASAERLGRPVRRGTVLELGCGVGRLIRPLADHFERCIGIDVSASMLARARLLNAHLDNCVWLLTTGDDLQMIPDESVDLAFSTLVLQHVPTRAGILRYVGEMARILTPDGLLVFQVPATMPIRQRLQPRRRAYAGLRRIGVPERVLYERLGLNPIRMNWAPRTMVERRLADAGVRLLDVERGWLGDGAATGREINLTYLATR